MKKSFKKTLTQSLAVVLAAVSTIGVGYVFAQPTSAPGGGAGVFLPINEGPSSQTKSGNLTINGQLDATSLCIAGSCQTSWPSASVQQATTSNSAANYISSCQTGWNQEYFAPYSASMYYCDTDVAFNVTLPMSYGGGVGVNVDSYSFDCQIGSYQYQWTGSGYEYIWYPNVSYPAQTLAVTMSGSGVNFVGTCRGYNWNQNNNTDVGYSASATVRYIF